MKFFDMQHPFYRPMWRRVVITALCFGWALFEFATANPFFGILFGAIAVFCAHQFFIAFDPKDPD
ncbi:hypothetical protein [Roseinatronobacter sp. NSM]|uniref:hypothetical protein n=1 Tax=Roseinatronobacter sp. NSM TaxID=3457785 RepID=UPI004035A95A